MSADSAFNRIKAALDKVDRSIEEARRRRQAALDKVDRSIDEAQPIAPEPLKARRMSPTQWG